MASVKLATLLIRTIAKPISIRIKRQAAQHERFKQFCVSLAQFTYRTEAKLRINMMGEPARHIRPLSEAKAIENGVNFLAEGFMFTVAASIILGETWRSSRSQSKRRDDVDDKLDELGTQVVELTSRLNEMKDKWEVEMGEDKRRNDELARTLERVVEIGLRSGWAEFQGTPLQFPRIQQFSKSLVEPSDSGSLVAPDSHPVAPGSPTLEEDVTNQTSDHTHTHTHTPSTSSSQRETETDSKPGSDHPATS